MFHEYTKFTCTYESASEFSVVLSFFNQDLIHRDHYFTSVLWVDDETVSITWMNRIQNKSMVTKCHPPAYRCVEVCTLSFIYSVELI